MISYKISLPYMKNILEYTFEDDLKRRLKNSAFRAAWKESEVEYVLAKQLIEKRLKKHISQRELAKRANTTQAVISRIETMNANPSLNTLQRIASVLNAKLRISFQ
jgi:ribosome-binding protein aMBF1 (putative translation factor)